MMPRGAFRLDFFKLIILVLLVAALLILVFDLEQLPSFQPQREGLEKQRAGSELSTQPESPRNEENFPSFPESDVQLTHDEASALLLDDHGDPKFRLDPKGDRWLPVIPEQILSNLPGDHQLVQDESNVWHLLDGEGDPLYSLDKATLEWAPVTADKLVTAASEDEASDTEDQLSCPGANPTHISGEGAIVEVVNAVIPLRSSPTAEARNIIQPLPIGTRLEVVLLPTCTTFLDGANYWWGVMTEDGVQGFAAEASAVSDLYYLEEIAK